MKSNAKCLNRLCLALMFVFFTKIHAQQIQGIYLSGVDFDNDKLSFAKEKKKKCKIKLHDFTYKPYVNVSYCDSVYKFNKDSIFGYKENSGNTYRFYNESIYPVLNQGEQILLYKTEKKTGNPKSPQTIVTYYFSKDSHSPLLLLTTRNLERAFPENKTFREFLEVHFKYDSELIEYDDVNRMYKINRLLELSSKPKNK